MNEPIELSRPAERAGEARAGRGRTGRATGLAGAARRRPSLAAIRRLNLPTALVVGLGLLALVLLVAAFAPLIAPYDPIAQDLGGAFKPPGSPGHLLGTDNYGRDILSRIIFSTRLDLQIG